MHLTGVKIPETTSAAMTSKQDAQVGCFIRYHATLSSVWSYGLLTKKEEEERKKKADCMKTESVNNEKQRLKSESTWKY